jgi:hypothetical protein
LPLPTGNLRCKVLPFVERTLSGFTDTFREDPRALEYSGNGLRMISIDATEIGSGVKPFSQSNWHW